MLGFQRNGLEITVDLDGPSYGPIFESGLDFRGPRPSGAQCVRSGQYHFQSGKKLVNKNHTFDFLCQVHI